MSAGDDLTLLRLHVAAVWGLAVPPLAPGEQRVTRDPAGAHNTQGAAWALYLADTAMGTVRLWRADLPAAARRALLARAHAAHGLPPAAPLPPGTTREVALARRAPPRITPGQAGHLARRLHPADSPLFERFERDSAVYYTDPRRAPVFGVVRAGQLLAIAHSSRRTGQACELGVETLPAARQRGLALAVTVRWAAAVAAEGLVPLYSALATNHASLALAHAAGYRAFATATYVADA